MTIHYDIGTDTLYVTFGDKSNSYGDARGSIILMRDADTDALTGITVLSFHRTKAAGELANLQADLGISFERDIEPKLAGIV